MESLVIDASFWRGRRVFLSGHTGLKGGWAALLLHSLGARVFGFALAPEGEPNLFTVAGVGQGLHHRVGGLRELSDVHSAMAEAQPEIVLHMGAQALVRRSYVDPVSTYAANVMGTVHVLEAARHASSVQAIVVVTSESATRIAIRSGAIVRRIPSVVTIPTATARGVPSSSRMRTGAVSTSRLLPRVSPPRVPAMSSAAAIGPRIA